MADNTGTGQPNADRVNSIASTASTGVSVSITTRLARAGVDTTGIVVSNNRTRSRTQREQLNRRRRRTRRLRNPAQLRQLLDLLRRLDHDPPRVVIDCEGFHEDVRKFDVMEVFVLPEDTLYLIDVAAMDRNRINPFTVNALGSSFTMKAFLEDGSSKKILWDLRSEIRCLDQWYNIRLKGILDCQFWEIGSRVKRNPDQPRERGAIDNMIQQYIMNDIGSIGLQSLRRAKRLIRQARNPLRRSPVPDPQYQWYTNPTPDVLLDYSADVKYMGLMWYDFNDDLKDRHDLIDDIDVESRTAKKMVQNGMEDADWNRMLPARRNRDYPRPLMKPISPLQQVSLQIPAPQTSVVQAGAPGTAQGATAALSWIGLFGQIPQAPPAAAQQPALSAASPVAPQVGASRSTGQVVSNNWRGGINQSSASRGGPSRGSSFRGGSSQSRSFRGGPGRRGASRGGQAWGAANQRPTR